MDPLEEIADLRRDVIALRRTVDTLVELLHQSGAFAGMDRSHVERRLSAAARAVRDEGMDAEPDVPPALAGSAYRGMAPGPTGGPACSVCRKALAEDDPELVLKTRGRVCVACFQRADDR